MNHQAPTIRTPRARHALALVEVIVSIAILGGLMGAVFNAVAVAAITRTRTLERIQGAALAENLMGEILSKNYTDTTPPPALLTVEITILGIPVTINSGGGDPSRAAFDGIDDFNGWVASPPIARDGSIIAGYTGWAQAAIVEKVPLASPNAGAVGTDTGLKRITVVITRNGREISRMVALRSRAWEGALDAR